MYIIEYFVIIWYNSVSLGLKCSFFFEVGASIEGAILRENSLKGDQENIS